MYPFVWNVLLAARNEGVGGVLTTMAVAGEPRVKALFGIPDEYAVAAVVPLGRPHARSPSSPVGPSRSSPPGSGSTASLW